MQTDIMNFMPESSGGITFNEMPPVPTALPPTGAPYSTGYFIRITPVTKEEILEWIQDVDYWFVAKEKSKRGVEHFHIVILDPEPDVEWMKNEITSTFKRIRGGQDYYCKLLEDLQKACSYSQKEGETINHWSKGFSEEFIKICNRLSYSKKGGYKKEAETIRRNFLLMVQDNDREYFLTEMIKLNVKYENNTYWSHLLAKLLTLTCKKRGNDYIEQLVREKLFELDSK